MSKRSILILILAALAFVNGLHAMEVVDLGIVFWLLALAIIILAGVIVTTPRDEEIGPQ